MTTISAFCFLLCVTWADVASISVEGLEGGEVSFQCSHRVAWKNYKYFCNNSCKSHTDILVTVRPSERVKSGRITLVDSGDGVFTVTFSRLRLSDSGRYWCGVDRPGFDTYTEVRLTVKENVTDETTVIPGLSTTWTYENISGSTQLTSETYTSRPTHVPTDSNRTNEGEQNISTVLYTGVSAVAILAILVLLMCLRKRIENSQPQPQVCSNSAGLVSADDRQAGREYAENGEGVQTTEKLSERFACTHHPTWDPPTCAAECGVPLRIYENICCSKPSADSRYSAVNTQDEVNSTIYIKPLCDTADTSASDSTDVRPKSLWFGLDLSGTV